MTREERERIINKLAQKASYKIDLESIINHFYTNQWDYYNSFSNKELEKEILK